RMIASIPALGRVPESQDEALVATREVLEPHVALRRKDERLSGDVPDASRGGVRALRFDQALAIQDVDDSGHARLGIARSAVDAFRRPAAAPRLSLVFRLGE